LSATRHARAGSRRCRKIFARRLTAEKFFAKVCNEIGTPTYKLQNNSEADNYGNT